MQSCIRSVGAAALAVLLLTLSPAALAQHADEDVKPGWLGVSIQDVTEDLTEALPRGVHEGALINNVVDDSPAEEGGLQAGDVIVKVNQDRIRNAGDLTRAIREIGAFEQANIEYYRNGRRNRAEVELAERARESYRYGARAREYNDRARDRSRKYSIQLHDDDEHPGVYHFDDRGGTYALNLSGLMGRPRLGVKLMDLSDQLAGYFGIAESEGVLVTEVVEESAAAVAGIKAGDVIVRVGDQDVGDSEQLREALGEYDEGGLVDVDVVRNGRRQTIAVELERVEKPRLRGTRWPLSQALMVPDFEFRFDRADLEVQMEQIREMLDELREELAGLRDEIR